MRAVAQGRERVSRRAAAVLRKAMQAKYTRFPKREQGPRADRNIEGQEESIPSLEGEQRDGRKHAPSKQRLVPLPDAPQHRSAHRDSLRLSRAATLLPTRRTIVLLSSFRVLPSPEREFRQHANTPKASTRMTFTHVATDTPSMLSRPPLTRSGARP
jgi:hypothetical protein